MSLAAPGTNPASNLELKLPHTIGSANQLLKVDGSGQLGWATDSTTDSTKLPLAGGTLTGDATFSGGSGAITLSANSDIRLTTGSWTGDYGAKIQHHDNYLFLQGGSNGVNLRNAAGTRQLTMTSDGHFGPANGQSYNLGSASLPWNNIHAKDFLILDGGSSHSHPYIQFHSNTTNVRKYRIMNGQGWNPDALLIYDIDADNTRLTIEPSGLGINRGANSLSHCLDVGGTAMIRGNTQIDGDLGLGIAAVPQDSGAKTLHIHHPTVGNPARAGLRLTTGTSGSAVSNGGFLGLDYSNQLYLYNQENGDLRVGTNGTERFRIKNDGRICMGSTNVGSTSADDLNIENTGDHGGITIRTPNNKWGSIHFADGGTGDERYRGQVSYDHGNDWMRFYAAGAEKLRIVPALSLDTIGNLGINVYGGSINHTNDAVLYCSKTNNADWAFEADADSGGFGGDYAVRATVANSASYGMAVYDMTNTTWRFRVNGAGAIYATNTTVQSISDQRLKENIVDANSQWNDIKALRFRNFKWKADSGYADGKTYLGLIAQEVEPISPNLVEINAQTKEDIENGVTDPEYKNVKYSIVWMKAVKALQEAMTKIEALETKVAALEAG